MSILALGAKAPPLEFYQPFIQENPIACEVAEDVVPEEVSELSSNITVQNEDSFEPNETTNSEEQKQKILQEIINEFSKKDKKLNSSLNGLNKFLSLLRNVKTQGNWESFLHIAGGSIPLRYRSGSAIRVQPTSLSRRPANLTRGSKRLSLIVKLNQSIAKRY
ncbi:hypothetical protein AVEN_161031-1 [Araneus ventricosus]|uniref:Uncharacterized protein n=1 Tax=Araneus ventricosus TaxID=182803 RepID=A0A4Y2WWC2_ARAVE|nr:hypothetical protein AVEN_161031-1 [Araneus ventricosus]